MAFEAVAYAGAIVRAVKSVERDGKPAKAVIATATYETSLEDLWDAVTTATRIERWFLPVSGELKLGGRYQLKGNAGGTVTACDAPRSFATTWEMGGQVSWVEVQLSSSKPGEATLELTHVAIVDDSFWPTYGPGAVGVGWDLGLLGLQRHIESPATERPPEADPAWATSPEALRFYRASSTSWGEAAAADGMVNAMQAAENTRKFYSGESQPDVMHAFDVLGDPVRRRILELLASDELASGEVVEIIAAEFGITQAAVSQHLKVLRESGFATVRAEGTRRLYTLDPAPLREVDAWLEHFRGFWTHKLMALGTEIARGKKQRR